jgi:transposase
MRTNPTKTTAIIATIGIDIGKTTFHLVGLDKRGAIVLQQKVSRSQLERRLVNVSRCLIGMEACSGAHHIGRQLEAVGHDVRLIPASSKSVLPQPPREADTVRARPGDIKDRLRGSARSLRCLSSLDRPR